MAFVNGHSLALGTLLLGLTTLVGCGGDDLTCEAPQVLNDAGDACIDDPTTVTPPPPPAYFAPVYWGVDGIFGYNADWDTTFPITATGQDGNDFVIDPLITITLATEAYLQQGDEAGKCIVQFVATGDPNAAEGNLALADWQGATLDFGFEFPAGGTPMDNCGDKNFDEAIWGTNVGATVASYDWGLGVMKTVDPDVMSSVVEAYASTTEVDFDADIKPFILGGGFYMSVLTQQPADFPGGFSSSSIAFAIELDADNKLMSNDDGSDKWIPAADVATSLPTAGYQVSAWFYLGGADQIFIAQ